MIVTETIWPTEPNLFTMGSFTAKICQLIELLGRTEHPLEDYDPELKMRHTSIVVYFSLSVM